MLWREVIADFERNHPDLQVRQEYVVGFGGHYNTKMRQQILSGTLPDVALIQLGPFHELAEHFADLTHDLRGSDRGGPPTSSWLHTTGVAAFRVRGRQRGLPISGGNLLIYANPDCFERASRYRGTEVALPTADWTIDDFRRTAELLTCDFDGDGRLDQFGFWLPRWVYYLPFIWSFGAELTSEDGTKWLLTGPEAEAALSFYRELALGSADGARPRVCPRPDEIAQLFQDTGFLTGKVALCVNGPWFQPFLAETKLAARYVVASIPSGPAGRTTRITWDGVVIPKHLDPERRRLAWSFVEYLISPDVQAQIGRSGRALPARTDSMSAYLETPDRARRRRFVDALSESRLQPLMARFGEIDRAINEHFGRLLDPAREAGVQDWLNALAADPVIAQNFPVPSEPIR